MSEANTAPAAEQEAEPSDFDKEFEAFLGHTFGGPDEDNGDGEETTPAAADPPAPAGAEPKEELKPEPASAEPPAAESAPGDGQPAPAAAEVVDPADLAAMLGLGKEEPPAPASSGAETTPASSTAEDEPFAPFQANFKIKPEIEAALFESEDAATRSAALVGLLASFGNAVTQVVVQHVREVIAPQITGRSLETMSSAQAAQAVQTHFYGTNPDLLPYKKAVLGAFAVIAKKDPKRDYSPELAIEVAKLARAGLKASGIVLAAPAAPAAPGKAPVKKATPSKAPGSAFEAGAARPSGTGATGDDGPANLVADLSDW